jgi:hypothetical protein
MAGFEPDCGQILGMTAFFVTLLASSKLRIRHMTVATNVKEFCGAD